MKKTILTAVLLGLSSFALADAIEGKWQTYDDKTKKPKGIVHIYKAGSGFNGKIVGLSAGVHDGCDGCAYQGKLIGLEVVKGLKATDTPNKWDDGKIYDPKSGKTYSSNATLKGNTLVVRGYVGVSALGRSQTWVRVGN